MESASAKMNRLLGQLRKGRAEAGAIRSVNLNNVLEDVVAARAQLAAEVVGPALEAGTRVVSDRTVYSSLAYQGGGRGLGVEEVRLLNETVLDGVLPDLVAVLDVEPEVGFARETERDRIGQDGLELQHLVSRTYRELAATDPRVMLVDANATPEELAIGVLEACFERLGDV